MSTTTTTTTTHHRIEGWEEVKGDDSQSRTAQASQAAAPAVPTKQETRLIDLLVEINTSRVQNDATKLQSKLIKLKEFGLTEETAKAFTEECKENAFFNKKSTLLKKIDEETKIYAKSKFENAARLQFLDAKITETRAYYWLIANKVFKTLGFAALSVFGLSSAFYHHTSNMTIHAKIDGFDKVTAVKKFPTYAKWMKTIMELLGVAGAGEFITNWFVHSKTYEKHEIAKLTTGQKVAYRIYRGFLKVSNALSAAMKVLLAYEIITIMAKVAATIAKVGKSSFNIIAFSKAAAAKAIAAKLAPIFKFLKPALTFMGFTMIAMLAASALKGIVKTITSAIKAIKTKTREAWIRLAKVGTKTIIKGVALAGAVLIASIPVVGWAMFGIATGILSLWSMSKLFFRKGKKITEKEFSDQHQEILNKHKESIKNSFFKTYKAELETGKSSSEAALIAKKATEKAFKAGKENNFTAQDEKTINGYIHQVYFQAQQVSPKNANLIATHSEDLDIEESALFATYATVTHAAGITSIAPSAEQQATADRYNLKQRAATAFLDAQEIISAQHPSDAPVAA